MPLSYAAEMHTSSCQPGVFTANLLRWPLNEAGRIAASNYAQDLAYRWTAVTEWRVSESDDAVTEEVTT